jgi:hypothetical protein
MKHLRGPRPRRRRATLRQPDHFDTVGAMMTLDEVDAAATAFPEVHIGERFGNRTWYVGKKAFAWERAFSKADLKRFGDETPPPGPILAVIVDDLGEKEAVLGAGHQGFFTIPHFNGYAAVLIELDRATKRSVRDALEDAWLAAAPKAVVAAYLANR